MIFNDANIKHIKSYFYNYTDGPIINDCPYDVYGDPWCWNKVFDLYGFPNCPIGQLPNEFKILMEHFIKLQPKNILEIGILFGGSLYYWLKHSPDDAKVLGINLNKHHFADMGAWDVNIDKFHFYQGNSTAAGTIDHVKHEMPEINFLFIDGDHNSAETDFTNYAPLVKNGLIVLHDINYTKIAPKSSEFWAKLKTQEGIIYREYCDHLPDDAAFGLGIIYVGEEGIKCIPSTGNFILSGSSACIN